MEPFRFNSAVFLILLLLALSFLFEVFPINCNALDQCLQAQSTALLQLKRGFTSGDQLETWRPGTDCCIWEGVTCDESRRVIVLDLSLRFIAGRIDPSLFNLTSLRTLNFSYSQFDRMPIPDSGWDRLVNLSSLDLSFAGFAGKVPAYISRLSKLTYLDLSFNFGLSLATSPLFWRTMSSLRELHLDGVNISAFGDEWCGALVNSTPVLEELTMQSCYLFGGFPKQIFQLRNLKYLDISFNPMLSGPFPDFPKDNNLEHLGLSGTNFFGNLSDTFGKLMFLRNLSSLRELHLDGVCISAYGYGDEWCGALVNSTPVLEELSMRDCCLFGGFPKKIFQLRNLKLLEISDNPMLSGPLPDFPKDNNLEILWLSNTNFSGNLPDTIGNLMFLKYLDLSGCRFSGRIPSLMRSLSQLEWLDLSNNNFSGDVELKFIKDLKNIEYLELSNNGFSLSSWDADDGSSWSSNFSKISHLGLVGCNLTKIPAFIKYQHHMEVLDLSNNRIHGEIPSWLWSISQLNLSCNFFRHVAEPSFNFSAYHAPLLIDLRSNMLEGQIPPLPPIDIFYLDFSNNQFTSSIPSNTFSHLNKTKMISLANNSLIGEIPPFIYNLTELVVLDLSNNRLTGFIPPTICNFMELQMLDLSNNRLRGCLVGSKVRVK